MALVDFTLSNARQFYLLMGNPSGVEGLTLLTNYPHMQALRFENEMTSDSIILQQSIRGC